MKKTSSGFTVIELLFVAILIGFASAVFFVQKNNLQIIARDTQRKTAINAIYYSLEKVFVEENGYYPETISSENITSMDPDLLKDPYGVEIGDPSSEYTYTPNNCQDGKCQGYILKSILENEGEYVKRDAKD